jgi:hydrogenase maturation protein HypF
VELEAIANNSEGSYPFDIADGDAFRIDFRETIRAIVRDFAGGSPVPAISARFHRTVAQAIVEACARIRVSERLNHVCLSGGTFQNLRLLEQSLAGLHARGFETFIHHRVPPNDGGLSLGQAAVANSRLLAI